MSSVLDIDYFSPGIKCFVERVEEIKQLKRRAAPSDDLEPGNDQHYYHLRDYDSEAPVNLSEADSGRVKHLRGVLIAPQIVSYSSENHE